LFELYIIIKRKLRPEVNQFYDFVPGADPVNSAKTLDDTNRIPVDVVIYECVAVLEVLPFGDTIGGNENIDLFFSGIAGISFFG